MLLHRRNRARVRPDVGAQVERGDVAQPEASRLAPPEELPDGPPVRHPRPRVRNPRPGEFQGTAPPPPRVDDRLRQDDLPSPARRDRRHRGGEAAHRVRLRGGDLGGGAGCFKPHRATYAKARERLDVDRSTVLFVANHAFDCIGAKTYGMRTAFIDRRRRPFGDSPHQPDLIVEDFAALARAMCG